MLIDLKKYIEKMSGFHQVTQWIDFSTEINGVVDSYLDVIQRQGLAELHELSIQERKIDTKWIRVKEVFFPGSFGKNQTDYLLWNKTMAEFIGSCKDITTELFLCINSNGRDYEFLFNGISNQEFIQNNLSAFFPGLTLDNGTDMTESKDNVLYCGGVPTLLSEDDSLLPIDVFLTSVYGEIFSISIQLNQVGEQSIRRLIGKLETLVDEIKVLNELNVTTGTAKGYQGVLNMKLGKMSGDHLIELISFDIERCKKGLTQGLWETNIAIAAKNKNLLNRLSSIFSSVYGADDSKPMRIQTRPEKFTSLLTSNEIATFYSFPSREVPGLAIKPLHSFGNNAHNVNNGIAIGEILFDMKSTGNMYKVDKSTLTKHTFITGITGSGKTTTVKRILYELTDQGVPFLVIEPAKAEYDPRKNQFINQKVNYIEVGNDSFSINLFHPSVKDTPIITHIDYLRAVFSASFVLYPPMPYVLESAIYRVYEKLNFKFDAKDEQCVHYPTVEGLIYAIEDVVKESGYSERLRDDILASLRIRFQNLLRGYKGKIFNSKETKPSFEDIMKTPTIINLHRIVDEEQKALLMSILLAYLFEYREKTGDSGGELRHVTVIEEAHRLLAKTTSMEGNPDTANPKARAVEFFANLLSEIRSYGEGLIIAEQIPSKLITDVIKNTGTKIAHKLVSLDDKMLMGGAMNFEEGQESFLTILERGKAIVFSENTIKPIVIDVKKVN